MVDWLAQNDDAWSDDIGRPLPPYGHHPDGERSDAGAWSMPSCRVFGIANLYIAGSSVFPTSGCANPTLTVTALALRLADHLRAALA